MPCAVLSAINHGLSRLEAAAARAPDPDDAELDQLVEPVREALRQLADELERRALSPSRPDTDHATGWDACSQTEPPAHRAPLGSDAYNHSVATGRAPQIDDRKVRLDVRPQRPRRGMASNLSRSGLERTADRTV